MMIAVEAAIIEEIETEETETGTETGTGTGTEIGTVTEGTTETETETETGETEIDAIEMIVDVLALLSVLVHLNVRAKPRKTMTILSIAQRRHPWYV